MSRVHSTDTRPEIRVRKMLHAAGYRFRLKRLDLPGKPDIVLPKYKTAVFVHGCFWHGHDCKHASLPKTNTEFWTSKIERNKARDAMRRKELESQGWRVFTIWECDLRGGVEELLRCLRSMKESIAQRPGKKSRRGT